MSKKHDISRIDISDKGSHVGPQGDRNIRQEYPIESAHTTKSGGLGTWYSDASSHRFPGDSPQLLGWSHEYRRFYMYRTNKHLHIMNELWYLTSTYHEDKTASATSASYRTVHTTAAVGTGQEAL